jgi:cellulose synthase/poly-beta-1,6-N-acetylglucosamine synthase-like glycosyltransferase
VVTDILTWTATAIAVALAPLAVLWLMPLVSDALMLVRRPAPRAPATGARTRLLVLVPAHNESYTIAPCVESLLAMRRERADARVIVVADNCADDTAAVARGLGAEVLERFDTVRRGKPPALAWAMTQVCLPDFDAVVIIDADTIVDAGFADALAAQGPLRDTALQAYHDTWNPSESWLAVLGELLAAVRYQGQYPAKARVGLNVPLTGNGMVLGTGVLERAGWVDDSLTENWELYARYTEQGERIGYAREARLFAQEARTLAQGSVQRRRWQAGRWIVFRTHLRPTLTSRKIGWHQKIDTLGELSVPGPILQAAVALLVGVALGLTGVPAARIVAAAFLLSLVPTIAWTAVAWARHPRPGRIALAFLRIPVYVGWRITVALLAVRTGRSGAWLRSPRHRPESAG